MLKDANKKPQDKVKDIQSPCQVPTTTHFPRKSIFKHPNRGQPARSDKSPQFIDKSKNCKSKREKIH